MMDKNINDNDDLHCFTCDKPLHEGEQCRYKEVNGEIVDIICNDCYREKFLLGIEYIQNINALDFFCDMFN